jgi:hypothetical protein
VNMRSTLLLLVLVLVVVVTGCGPEAKRREPPSNDVQAVNAMFLNSFNDSAINGAIITQHTLYPYHFEAGGAALNELGRHDLRILAAHFKDNPGQLNIRRGDVAQALYDTRVAEVNKALVDGGVAKGRVSIVNSLPGGEGASADRVLKILDRESKTQSFGTTTGSFTSGASMSGGSK